jgi:hypothetical protein
MKGSLHVKLPSLLPSAAAAFLFAAAVLANARPPQDQAPAGAPQGGARPMRGMPAPTNLKVLPKDITGQQLRETMGTWAGSLGVHCDFCHAADTSNPGPNGRPRMNFADDSKTDKQIARIMYTMTEQINKDYVSKAMAMDPDGMGKPVTCGTCHRGHEMPEAFVIPAEAPRGGQGMPGMPGMPAGGAAPPAGTPPPSN